MSKLPKHVAIIMDGNGRWAQTRHHARSFGHVMGAKRAHEITRAAAKLGIEALTLYTFSKENWLRPITEVDFLWKLLFREMKKQRNEVLENNLRFRVIGFKEELPDNVQKELASLEEESQANTGMFLNLALSYGSRQEIVRAVKDIVEKVQNGILQLSSVDESTIEEHLFTSCLPAPDLLIRTGGEKRISNFLLWQMAYTEFAFLDVAWPDFNTQIFEQTLQDFGQRDRRYGKILTKVE